MGFGPGPNWSPQQAYASDQASYQRRITGADTRINSIFDSPARQAEYAKLGADTTGYYTGQLNRQHDIANRQMKFALANQGQVGSSQAGYNAGVSGRDYQQGLLHAGQLGQSASSNLRIQDQRARSELLGLAQAGMGVTQAGQRADQLAQTNFAAAQPAATAQSLGDAFGNLAQSYQNIRNAAENRALQRQYYRDLYRFGVPASYGG